MLNMRKGGTTNSFERHTDLWSSYHQCSEDSLLLGDSHFEEAVAYAQKELEIEVACAGADTGLETSATIWLAALNSMADEVRKAACDKSKKVQRTAKTTAKKDRRVIRNAANRVAALPEEVGVLFNRLTCEELSALASKLRGGLDVLEMRALLRERIMGLKDDGRIKANELRRFE